MYLSSQGMVDALGEVSPGDDKGSNNPLSPNNPNPMTLVLFLT